MIEKYQEALDSIKEYMEINDELNCCDNVSNFNRINVETIQELINKFENIKSEMIMICKQISSDELSQKQLERKVRTLNGKFYE